MAPAEYPPVPYRYRWVSRVSHPERRGQRCRVLAWPPRNDAEGGLMFAPVRGVLVEFMDGAQIVGERGMVRLARGTTSGHAMDRQCRQSRCGRPVGRSGSHGMCARHALRHQRHGH